MKGRRQPDGFFCCGATLYQLHDGKRGGGWVGLEGEIEALLHSRFKPAFASKDVASEHLGSQGGGYTECYRADDQAAYRDALSTCSRIMLAHSGGQCLLPEPEQMHGRTDERTYVEPPRPRVNPYGSRRTRAYAETGWLG